MDFKFPSYYYDYIYAPPGTHRVYKRNHLISRSASASVSTHIYIKELYANTSITPACAHTYIKELFFDKYTYIKELYANIRETRITPVNKEF
jgi:hypothetical protein